MPRPAYIVLHAAVAGAFFFVLQTQALGASAGTALVWATAFAAAAAALAWRQTKP